MQIALRNAVPKIIVFLLSVLLLIIILGTIMYIFEGLVGGNPGFQDIPNSIYWSIVTLTTVGYGNVVPVTVIGKIIAAAIKNKVRRIGISAKFIHIDVDSEKQPAIWLYGGKK